jgi:Carboxypeptidase regulatory-like domain
MNLMPHRTTLVILWFAFVIRAFGQGAASASLTASFEDPSGAAIPAVRFALTNSAATVERQATAGANGSATIALLPPGVYTLKAQRDGFKPLVMDKIILEVGDQLALKAPMQVGDVQETVTVVSDPLLLQTESTGLSFKVDERHIKDLPLNGKNFQLLILLTPGVGAGPNNPAISGARSMVNTYTIDGLNSSNQRSSTGLSLGGGAGSLSAGSPNLISTEALQEFQVVTSSADATYGRSSGGQINLITKSGSNQWHGSAYYYGRNDALDARNFFNTGPFKNSDGSAKVPPFKQHLFGGTLGTHIRKNRDFIFASYEGFRQDLRLTDAGIVVPNAALIGMMPGDLGKFYKTYFIDRQVVPATGNPPGTFAPLYSAIADRQRYIDAGFSPAAVDQAGTVRISSAQTRDVNQDSFLVRTDHRLSDRLKLTARYSAAHPKQLTNILAFPNNDTRIPLHWHHAMVQATALLRPNQILEVRGGFLRSEYQQNSLGGVEPRLRAVGISEFGISINANGTGLSQLFSAASQDFVDNQTVPEASVLHTWTLHKLTLRSGVQLRRSDLNTYSAGSATPVYNFNGFLGTNGILGAAAGQSQAIVTSANVTIFGAGGGVTTPLRGWRQTEQEYFTQADWRVRPDVTVNFGIRYAYFGVLHEVNNVLSNLYAADGSGRIVPDVSPLNFGRSANTIARVDSGRPFYRPDYKNFQPRAGIAWNIGGKDRTVVRAAYGLFTDRIYQLMVLSAPNSSPFSITGSVSSVPFQLGVLPPINANVPAIFGIDPTIRNPRDHRWNVSVQQRIDSNTSVTASYVGAAGRGLTWNAQLNGGNAGVPQNLRPDPRYGVETITYGNGASDYSALQISARRRLAHGVDFTAAYTYAHANDNVSDEAFGSPPALINLGASSASGFSGGLPGQWLLRPLTANWGAADFDIRHNLAISHVVELPFGKGRRFLNSSSRLVDALLGGYDLAGIVVLHSGNAFTVIMSGDLASVGAFNIRPALKSGTLPDLYAPDGSPRIQFLLPAAAANTRLGLPASLADPFASIPRNAFYGPPVYNYDASLSKRFLITERVAMRFEANAFNLFNRAQFGSPNGTLTSAFFGQVSGYAAGTNPRQLQFGLRLSF